jgi:hypothetical protein
MIAMARGRGAAMLAECVRLYSFIILVKLKVEPALRPCQRLRGGVFASFGKRVQPEKYSKKTRVAVLLPFQRRMSVTPVLQTDKQ